MDLKAYKNYQNNLNCFNTECKKSVFLQIFCNRFFFKGTIKNLKQIQAPYFLKKTLLND